MAKMGLSQSDMLKMSYAKNKKKKIVLCVIAGILAVALIVAICVVVAQMKERNRIAKAKSVVQQLDLSTLYGTASFPDNEDWDNDGVNNGNEDKNGTNLQNEDTDGDGITDGQELLLGTDPLKADTDNDGLLDGYEVMAGTDPRMSCTDGETNDADRELTIKKSKGQVTLEVTGDANVANTTIEELDLFGISSNASIVSNAYDFYTDYDFKSATVTFALDDEKISSMGYSYDDLSVLYFDPDTLKYSKIDSTVDKAGKTISANLTHFSTYVVGVDGTVNEDATTRVAFLVDNSGSMYPEEMCAGSTENDVDFKRIDFANSLVSKFANDYQISVSKYTGSYTQLQDFTTDRSAVESALDKIKTQTETFNGTHSQTAIQNCINEFSSDNDGKYRNIIVMLTDGESDETNGKSVETLAKLAKEKNIIILTVGLGRDIDRSWLQQLAYSTGGKYFTASDANALNEVYKQIVTTLNYDIVSYSDSADSVMGYSLYNTGFSPETNGFAFKNFRTTTTTNMDYGMALMARDWYLGNLEMSLGDITPAIKNSEAVESVGYALSGTTIGNEYNSRTPLSQISVEALTSSYANATEYLDYSSEGDTLKVKVSEKSTAENKGWQTIEFPINNGTLEWSKVEFLALDIAGSKSFKIALGYSDDELEFYKALYRYNAIQWQNDSTEFNLTNGDEGFEKLESQLSLGVPVVTIIDGTHVVNAIGLIQDSSCHRQYILQIYDSNYPDETKEIYITKLPLGKFNIDGDKATLESTSFEYSATYEGKQVGLSFTEVDAH